MQLIQQLYVLQIVYAPAIDRLLKNVQSKDVTVHKLKDAMHDLLLTPQEQEVSELYIKWMLDHSSDRSSL